MNKHSKHKNAILRKTLSKFPRSHTGQTTACSTRQFNSGKEKVGYCCLKIVLMTSHAYNQVFIVKLTVRTRSSEQTPMTRCQQRNRQFRSCDLDRMYYHRNAAFSSVLVCRSALVPSRPFFSTEWHNYLLLWHYI